MDATCARSGVPAHVALPAGFTALLVVGATAAALGGHLPPGGVDALAAVVVAGISLAAQPAAAAPLALLGWLTIAGFSAPPYAQLRAAGPAAVPAAVLMGSCALAGICGGVAVRRALASVRLWSVGWRELGRWRARPAMAAGIRGRRQAAGVLLVAGLPLLTAALAAVRQRLDLTDDILLYLVAVVVIAVVGGFWPAVLAAVTASLLLNWYFTVPLHTLTIAEPRNLLALLLFVTVAVTVSSVVHLAARRAVQAARSGEDAAALLALAQTVLGGEDSPSAVLDHLTATWGGHAALLELAGGEWVTVARSGTAAPAERAVRVRARPGLELAMSGQSRPLTTRLLDGFAAQAGAALDRDRLRTQAAQAEALAEGNRMRTALLAAVSHDLRTPLASIKASVSTLRQTDVQWAPTDQAVLLAAIEEASDRLDALIGNLLDASRLATGSLRPFLRPTAIDEVAPVALGGLGGAAQVALLVPDGLPLVRTDPVLLERVLANLFANAISHSPPGRPPVMRASQQGGQVVLEVVDQGPGVPGPLKARIFEPFERLGERGAGSGVGLGLAVAKGFLDAMGATVTPLDTAGGGLTMQVVLPVAAAAGSPAGAGP